MELGQEELGRLLRYAELVREWNHRINLVSRQDIGNLVSGHIVDSLAGVSVLKRLLGLGLADKEVSLESKARGLSRDDIAPTHPPLMAGGQARDDTAPTHPPLMAGGLDRDNTGSARPNSIAGSRPREAAAPAHPPKGMDLGSGGGLPGIPLKICLPEIEFTLLESTKKKARFLETAVLELGLAGVAVVDRHSRELEGDPAHRGRYDLVTARAVAELKELVLLSFPFLKPGGWLVAYKGTKAGEEIALADNVLKRLHGSVANKPLPVDFQSNHGKQLIVVNKIR